MLSSNSTKDKIECILINEYLSYPLLYHETVVSFSLVYSYCNNCSNFLGVFNLHKPASSFVRKFSPKTI